MQYKIKDWKDHQHYSDRNPPWIKLHRTIVDKYNSSGHASKFASMSDSAKLTLIMAWVLAARYDGVIPCDKEWFKHNTNISQVNIDECVANGFLILDDSDASSSASKFASDRASTRVQSADADTDAATTAAVPDNEYTEAIQFLRHGDPADSVFPHTAFIPVQDAAIAKELRGWPKDTRIPAIREMLCKIHGSTVRSPIGTLRAFLEGYGQKRTNNRNGDKNGGIQRHGNACNEIPYGNTNKPRFI